MKGRKGMHKEQDIKGQEKKEKRQCLGARGLLKAVVSNEALALTFRFHLDGEVWTAR